MAFNLNINNSKISLMETADIPHIYNWIAACENGNFTSSDIGTTVQLPIGDVMATMVLIGVNHDDLAGTDNASAGKAKTTWMVTGYINSDAYMMNDTATNVGGWNASKGPTYCQNLYDSLIPCLKDHIKPVKKPTQVSTVGTVANLNSKVFMLSYTEVGGISSTYSPTEGSKYAYFNSNKPWANFKANIFLGYFLRSPYKSNSSKWCIVDVFNGGLNYSSANSSYYGGFVFAFCI